MQLFIRLLPNCRFLIQEVIQCDYRESLDTAKFTIIRDEERTLVARGGGRV